MSLLCSAFIITINQLQFTLHVLFIFASHRIIPLFQFVHLILSPMEQMLMLMLVFEIFFYTMKRQTYRHF